MGRGEREEVRGDKEVHAREGRMEKEREEGRKGEGREGRGKKRETEKREEGGKGKREKGRGKGRDDEEKRNVRKLGSVDVDRHPSLPTSYQSILHEVDAIARHFLC